MNPLTPARKASAALLIGAFVLSACGGGNPTTAPSIAAGSQAAPSTAASLPPASVGPASVAPASVAPASAGAVEDPADDLKIAAPYEVAELDPQISQLMVTAMTQALGTMADAIQVGVRSVEEGGTQVGFVIVMSFPNLPIGADALLDAAANGANQSGSVESRKISGQDVRIVESSGQAGVMMVLDGNVVMAIGMGSKDKTIDIAKAIIEGN